LRSAVIIGGLFLVLVFVNTLGSTQSGTSKKGAMAARTGERAAGISRTMTTSGGATSDSAVAAAPTSAPTPVLTPTSTQTPPTTSTRLLPTPNPSLTFPIRAAFYYPWFPEGWNQQGLNPFTMYHPSLGFYSSSNSSVIAQQIRAMQYANIQVGIASWWGQGSITDGRVPLLLQQAAGTGFKWALHYEAGGNPIPGVIGSPNPAVGQINLDLSYIKSRYASNPSYLHVDGKPVIFVYGNPTDSCDTAARWQQANTLGFYVNLQVFPGYAVCPSQPDGWHQYSPAVSQDSQPGYSFTISPGFNKANEATPRLARDPTQFAADVRAMVASNAPWQLITTFDEWGEGTAVESAQEWSSPSGEGIYLDILHNDL